MSSLSVFYTCFTEQEAVEYSLEMLLNIYNDCPVYLVSEGTDFSYLEDKYPSIKTFVDEDTRGFISHINYDIFRTEKIQEKILKSIYLFLERLKKAIDYGKTSHILIMEPDVLVRGKLVMPPSYAKITGCKVNPFDYNTAMATRKMILEIPGAIDMLSYGAVAPIIETKAFLEVYDFVMNNPEFIKKLTLTSENIANYDVLLPLLFCIKGYEEYNNPDFTECLRNPQWKNSHHNLIHQFREKYPRNGYIGRHGLHINKYF